MTAPVLPEGATRGKLVMAERDSDDRSRRLIDGRRQRGSVTRARRQRRVGFWLAVAWLAFVVGAAVLAELLPLAPFDRVVKSLPPRTGPGLRLSEPFGTDSIGRSMTSRLVHGARQSLLVGVVSASIAATIGTMIGTVAGFLRGTIDRVLSFCLDTLLAFPGLVLLMAIAAIGRRNVATLVVGLSILGVPMFARVTRAKTLGLAEAEFVIAARSMGASTLRIMVREIVPNLVPVILSVIFLVLGGFIVAEGTLSFLGLGVPPPTPSWGGMINEGRQLLRTSPHLIFVPAGVLVATVMSLRIVGERIGARITASQGEHR